MMPPSLEIDLARMFEVVFGREVDDLGAGVLVHALAGDADVEVVGARALALEERARVEHHVLGAHRAADPFDGAVGVDDRRAWC